MVIVISKMNWIGLLIGKERNCKSDSLTIVSGFKEESRGFCFHFFFLFLFQRKLLFCTALLFVSLLVVSDIPVFHTL